MPTTHERVLITGGSGFLAAGLARALLGAGHEVHLLLRKQSNLWRLAGLEGRYVLQWADLRDAAAVRRAVADAQPAVVYHLAAHGVYPFQQDTSAIYASTFLGTANLLEALAGHDYRAFVHAGSSAEYGPKAGPMRPGDRLEPRTPYGVAKAAATLLCQAEAARGRPIVTVRIFTVYGPWEEPTRLVPYVMGCCLRGERPQVTSGQQARDFIHVDDAIDLLQIAARTPGLRGQILNAATGRQHRVRDVVEAIIAQAAQCGSGRVVAQYGARPNRFDEPETWEACIEETTALTGWKPGHDLRSGIAKTWDWLRQASPSQAA